MASEAVETDKLRRGGGNRWVCNVCGQEMPMSQAVRGFCEIMPRRTDCPLPLREGRQE